MEQFLALTLPYFATAAVIFNLACLVGVIRNGRKTDKALDEVARNMDEISRLRKRINENNS